MIPPKLQLDRSRFKLNRRAFLRGAGTAGLVLPFLESLPDRSAFAAGETPKFGLFLCTSCGVVGSKFWPTATGALTTASMEADGKSTSVLAPYADRLLMVKGVNYPGSASGCAHADGLAKCLTASTTSGGGANVTPNGISCDTAIAEGLGVSPLTLYAGLKGGYIEEKLSFSAPGKVRAAEGNPYNVYLDLAGLLDGSTGTPTPMADYLFERRKSVNDLVRGDLGSLINGRKISASDKLRLEQHLQSIRDIENDMTSMPGLACSGSNLDMAAIEAMNGGNGFSRPYEENGRQEEVVMLQLELCALAFACNTTQVATLQAGDGTDGTQYTINGQLYERFHHISHRVNSDGTGGSAIANAEEKHFDIDKLRLQSLLHGIEKWSQFETPNGPLLDTGFIYWTSHVSDGPSHSFKDLPIIVVGNAGGYLKQGEYVNAGGVSNAQLLNTLITANGVPTENFGEGGSGLIPEMLA